MSALGGSDMKAHDLKAHGLSSHALHADSCSATTENVSPLTQYLWQGQGW